MSLSLFSLFAELALSAYRELRLASKFSQTPVMRISGASPHDCLFIKGLQYCVIQEEYSPVSQKLFRDCSH